MHAESTPPTPPTESRRAFLKISAAAGTGILIAGCQMTGKEDHEKEGDEEGEKVTPGEDLMQEHGVLKRILLVYGEGIRRIDANEEMPPEALQNAAKLVRSFVEEYHEKNEEKYIFPEFERAKKLVDLVEVLKTQHLAGRDVTAQILNLSQPDRFRSKENRNKLVKACGNFIRMYRPHESREDTVCSRHCEQF